VLWIFAAVAYGVDRYPDNKTRRKDGVLALALALALAIARNAEHAADLSGGPKRHNHITSFAPCLMFA
jgi:hypothetical protein